MFALIRKLKKGDRLYVWKIDRFARSLLDLLQILQTIDKAGATFSSITEPIDTSTPIGVLMVQLLGAFAQFERSIIRERCIAGQKIARAKGVHCGRPRSLPKEDEAELLRMHASGNYTMKALATYFGIHQASVKRAIYRSSKPDSSSLL